MPTTDAVDPQTSLAELAATRAGASRVFHRHRLDFCCHGRTTLAEACAAHGLDPADLAREIELEARADEGFERWDEAPLPDLIDHVLDRFHAPLRAELPRLQEMAHKIERVHADKPTCPTGIAALLDRMGLELELHMQKEEQVLFPLVRAGRGRMAMMPIQVMEQEHLDVAKDLAHLRALTADLTAPPEACGTWKALYLGLQELELELMRHIHLENNVLFPRTLGG